MKKSVIAVYTVLLMPMGSTVVAQTTPHQSSLTEIVVTAEFRPVTLQNQASSVSVVNALDIQERAAQHLEEVLNLAPNVNFSSGSSRARFYQIRGIGERSQFQEPLNPSVGFIIDDIDMSGLGSAGTLFDVDQVEVLRGPQGTLHGANALAGLINIRTKQPQQNAAATVEAGAAQYNTWNLGAVSTGPLIDHTLLYRLAINTYQSDGFIDNEFLSRKDTNNRDETTIRGKLRWLASDRSSVDVTAMIIDLDNGYDAFSLDNTRHTLSDQPGQDKQQTQALAANWHTGASDVEIEAAVSYANSDTDYGYDEDWSFVGISPALEYSSFDRYRRNRDSFSAQLRVLSREHAKLLDGSTAWVLGAYILSDREDLIRDYTYLEQSFRSDYHTDTAAIFGQIDTRLSDVLTLTAGLRYEHRDTDYSDNNGVSSDPSKDLWGGKLVLEASIGDVTLAYASASRGYRANGVNANILSSLNATGSDDTRKPLKDLAQYDEESLINYELGVKSSFADKQLHTRLAVFYMNRVDQQVKGSLTLPRDDGSTAFIDYTNNAARGNNYGAELELDWQLSPALSLYANLGVLQTEFTRYINASGEDLAGREQAQAPSYQYAAGGKYRFGGGFYARLDIEGKDDYFFSDRHEQKSPSYNLLHVRLGYQVTHWSLALWCRNCSDKDYFVRGFGGFGNDPRKGYAVEPYYQFGDPRVVGISATYEF